MGSYKRTILSAIFYISALLLLSGADIQDKTSLVTELLKTYLSNKYQLDLKVSGLKYYFPSSFSASEISLLDQSGEEIVSLRGVSSDIQIKDVLKKKLLIEKLHIKEILLGVKKLPDGKDYLQILEKLKSMNRSKKDSAEKEDNQVSFNVSRFTSEKIMLIRPGYEPSITTIIENLRLDITGRIKERQINTKADKISLPFLNGIELEDLKSISVLSKSGLATKTMFFKINNIIRAKASITYNKSDSILNSEIELSSAENKAVCSFGYELSNKYISRLNIHTDKFTFSDIYNIFNIEKSRSKAAVSADITYISRSGHIDDCSGSGKINITAVSYNGNILPDLNSRFQLADKKISLSLKQGDTNSEINGVLDKTSSDIKFLFRSGDLSILGKTIGYNKIKGKLSASGRFKGSFYEPLIKMNVAKSEMQYMNIPFSIQSASFVYENKNLKVESFQTEGETLISEIDPDLIRIKGLNGNIKYKASFQGPIDELKGKINLELTEAGLGNFKFDELMIESSLKNGDLIINSGRIIHKDFSAIFSGHYKTAGKKGSFSLKAENNDEKEFLSALLSYNQKAVKNFQLENCIINLSRSAQILDLQKNCSGSIEVEADVSKINSSPEINLSLKAQEIVYGNSRADQIILEGTCSKELLQVKQLKIDSAKEVLVAEAEIPLEFTSAKKIIVDTKRKMKAVAKGNVDLVSLPLFTSLDATLSGTAYVSLAINGSIIDPLINGVVEVSEGRYRNNNISESIEDINIDLKFEDHSVLLNRISFSSLKNIFDLNGTVDIEHVNSYSLDISGNLNGSQILIFSGVLDKVKNDLDIELSSIDLRLFQPFTESIKGLSGKIVSRLRISGPGNSLSVKGNIDIRDFSAALYNNSIQFSEGNAHFVFSDKELLLNNINAKLNNGTIKCSGHINYSEISKADADLYMQLDNNSYEYPGILKSRLKKVDLELHAISGQMELIGSVDPGFLLYTKDIGFSDAVKRYRISAKQKKNPEIFKKLRLKIELKKTEQVTIKNNLGKLTAGINGMILGTADKPVFTGSIYIKDGYIYYLDRTFDITKGKIDFNDPTDMSYYIDLEASTTVRSYKQDYDHPYKITLAVNGYYRELKTTLVSDPYLDESDIVSLLTIGATGGQLTTSSASSGTSEAMEVLAYRLGSLTSRRINGYVSASIGNLLSLDDIQIDGNLMQLGSSSGPSVRATKNLTQTTALTYINELDGTAGKLEAKRSSDKAELTYVTGVGDTNEQRVKLGYRLSKYFMLQSQADRLGNSGISLKYSIWKK